jgi:aspartate-semialdehyde dehydrogenase
MVGQRFIQALNGHPDYEVSALFASPASAGRPYRTLANGC